MAKVKKQDAKRVVYLFGAGATQAEISLKNSSIRLLTSDVREGMLRRLIKNNPSQGKHAELKNELSNQSVDVEHLITLYESGGNARLSKIASLLRSLFRAEVLDILGRLGTKLVPTLYPALIDMHQIADTDERIAGLLTLNYEDVLDNGIQAVIGNVDYSIKMKKKHDRLKPVKNADFPILKLHGSFNWENTFPVTLTNDDKIGKHEDVLWIPPGVDKNRDNYPFSLLWGRAMEVLDCDVLRVIGCSLNRNDWQLVSLLQRTQKLRNLSKRSKMEIINTPSCCNDIKSNYSYLEFDSIYEIREVRELIINDLGVELESKKEEAILQYLENHTNPFALWLRSKGEYLLSKSISIDTPTQAFKNYIMGNRRDEN